LRFREGTGSSTSASDSNVFKKDTQTATQMPSDWDILTGGRVIYDRCRSNTVFLLGLNLLVGKKPRKSLEHHWIAVSFRSYIVLHFYFGFCVVSVLVMNGVLLFLFGSRVQFKIACNGPSSSNKSSYCGRHARKYCSNGLCEIETSLGGRSRSKHKCW
jgi:hypothetical protein